ncbi:MAG: bifunctional nuclease domain-containing protein, partial [Dehalococcoidia bacterium]
KSLRRTLTEERSSIQNSIAGENGLEPVKVNRLHREEPSGDSVLVLEGKHSGEKFKVVIPEREAMLLALEAHGLNDRCRLYNIMAACVEQLGGALGRVVIRLNKRGAATAYMVLLQGETQRWLHGNAGEVLALASHVQLPIFLDRAKDGRRETGRSVDGARGEVGVPPVFESALAEIIGLEPTDEEGN